VHSAALIKARSEAEFDAANRGGTENLLAAIESANPGLKRLAYISSVAAHGSSPDGKPRPVDAPPIPLTVYGRTKLAGERAVRKSSLASRSIVFRMPVIYGPRDPALLPFFQAARMRVAPLLQGGNNRTSIIYATDAASAVVQSLTTGFDVGGKTYAPEDGCVYTWRDLLAAIKAAVGRRVIVVPTPKIAYQLGATASEIFGRATGRAVVFTREKVREMAQPAWVVSSQDLRRDLGWEPKVQIDAGARLTYDWYREQGWL
jgi:nucleoside-diphosphate-sugar epimerase